MDEIAQKLLEDVIAEVKENSVQPLSSGLQKRLLDYDQSSQTTRCINCGGFLTDGSDICWECHNIISKEIARQYLSDNNSGS